MKKAILKFLLNGILVIEITSLLIGFVLIIINIAKNV